MNGNEVNSLIDGIKAEDTMHGKFLTFLVRDDIYGIEIQYVIEIIGIQSITYVPHLPHYMKGILNLRGTSIPIMDIRLRFNCEPQDYNDRTCIIVIELEGTTIGLIVDSVQEVVDISDENTVLPPKTGYGANNEYIKGIGKVGDGVRLLLDVYKVFAQDGFAMQA